MTHSEALKRALELAHEGVEIHSPNSPEYKVCAALIALAQPEQEPVAYGMWDTMIGCGGRMMMVRLDKGQDGCTVPLYTTPPQRTWVGLTDEEIDGCDWGQSERDHAKAVEAKLKEKNT